METSIKETVKKERFSNYELLRIAAGLAVIVLHINYNPAGGGTLETAQGSSYWFLLIMETLCISAVNVFIMLSGYFCVDSKSIKLNKLVKILIQTMLFSAVYYALTSLVHGEWDLWTQILSFIPASFFVILYISLMMFAPFINKLIRGTDQRSFNIMTGLAFAIFSGYSICVDVFKELTGVPWNGLSSVGLEGSMSGYTIVNFLLVYIIGAWIRKDGRLLKKKTGLLIMILIGIITADIIWRLILPDHITTRWSLWKPRFCFPCSEKSSFAAL